jgi:putative sterol carrier protein
MEPINPQEFFEKVLPNRFNAEKSKGIDVTVQVTLTGNNPSDWVIIIKDQKFQVTKGTIEAPTLSLKASEADFLDLVNGKISAEKAFFSGKVNFKGNIITALKLRETGLL